MASSTTGMFSLLMSLLFIAEANATPSDLTDDFFLTTGGNGWKLIEAASSLCVGPVGGDNPCEWWQNSLQDATQTRTCLFDDVVLFNADGVVDNVRQSETWLEPFQSGGEAQCGSFVTNDAWNPSDDGTWAWNPTTSELTLTGYSSYLGLIKAQNGFEIQDTGSVNDIPETRTYTVTGQYLNYHCGDTNQQAKEMTAKISVGTGQWTFRYVVTECNHHVGCTSYREMFFFLFVFEHF